MLNATVTRRYDVTLDLIVFGIKPDTAPPQFLPGQYVALGLLGSAPRAPGLPPESEQVAPHKLVKRAYSICSSPENRAEIELYIGILPLGALTTRLVNIKPGDRVYLAPKITGAFTISGVPAVKNLIFFALGTGIAPYVSMLRTSNTWTTGRRITLVHSVRESRDLAYRAELEMLAAERPEFKYVPTVTGEDASWQGQRGRVQALLRQGVVMPDPVGDHVFVCGNSEAIADIERLLIDRGFLPHTKKAAGNIHEERYD